MTHKKSSKWAKGLLMASIAAKTNAKTKAKILPD